MIEYLSGLKLVPRYVDSWICNCSSKCFIKKGKNKQKIQTILVIVYKPFGIPLRDYVRQFATVDDLSELNQQIIAHHEKIGQAGISLEDIDLDRIFIRPASKQIRFLPNRYTSFLDRDMSGNEVFFQLTKHDLEQHFKQKYKFIQGPVTLTEHYDAERDLRVYIFGDVHKKLNAKCPNSISIDLYLRQILRLNPDKVVDVFLEAPFQDMNQITLQRVARLKWGVGFLFGNVRENWQNCLFSDKVLCGEPNLRLHYTDVRAYIQSLEDIDVSSRALVRLSKKQVSDKNTQLKRRLDRLVNAFEQVKREYPDGVSVSDLLEKLKINKQLNSIVDDPEAVKVLKRELITKGVNQYIDSLDFDTMDAILKRLRKNKTVSDWTKSKSTIEKLKDIGELLLYLMDIYTMSRLFRSYTNKKSNSDQYADRAKYAVIYVGDHHARNYRGVLKKLGFKQVKQATAEETQCLNVAKFHQPFFTQS